MFLLLHNPAVLRSHSKHSVTSIRACTGCISGNHARDRRSAISALA